MIEEHAHPEFAVQKYGVLRRWRMRLAFTMIELIFVIVVVGILAAIAIPKLAATRDDAKIVAVANKVANAANEIAAYAVSQGDLNITDLSGVSNVLKAMVANRDAVDDHNGTVRIKMGSVSDCLRLQLTRSGGDVNLTLSYGNGAGDPVCRGLQSAINAERYPVPLRGARVAR
jgi:general secretion pathway protein G